MDECRRGPTPRRRSHLPRACKSVEQEEDEDEEVVEDERVEKEVEEEEQQEEEEAEGTPTNQDDEDGEEVEDVAEGTAYQPVEVTEAAAEAAAEAAVEQAVVAQIDHTIEEGVKRIRDMWDVPESPVGESSSINKRPTSRPLASPTSTVREESPPAIAGPATCPPAPVTPPLTPRKSAPLSSRSSSVRVKRRLLERWRSLAAIQARRSAWRSFSSIMKQLDDGH